jgi:hypothetical protein
MRVTHELTVNARCPVDGAADVYAVTVEVYRVLKVEDILAAVDEELKAGPVFQEALTERLAARLKARVVTAGRHSGVLTTVECGR